MSKLSGISPVPGAGTVTGIKVSYIEDVSIRSIRPDGEGSVPQPIRIRAQRESTITEADCAKALSEPRRIALTGAVEGEALFDGSGDVTIFTEGEIERDYKWIRSKPRINGTELVGNMSPHELGLQAEGEYANAAMTDEEIDRAAGGEPGETEDDSVRKYLGQAGLAYFYSKIDQRFAVQEDGKGLSSNDFTDAYAARLDALDPDKVITDDYAMSEETIQGILSEADAQTGGG